jgi:hypothetical protein
MIARQQSRRFLVIATSLALAVGTLMGFALAEKNYQSGPKRQDTKTDSRNTTPVTPPIATANSGNTPQGTNQPNYSPGTNGTNAGPDWNMRATVMTAVFNGVLAVVTILLWCVGRQQARLFDHQNRIMRQQSAIMDGQLVHTEKAANAAQKSADALNIVHRQWLQIVEWNRRSNPSGTDQLNITVTVRIRNTSPLPLTIRTVRCYVNRGKATHGWSNQTLGPKEETVEDVFYVLTETEKAKWQNDGLLRLILAGWIHYWDAFSEPREQIIGASLDIYSSGELDVRGVADLPRNLARIARNNPWPLNEPDFPYNSDGAG